MKLYLSSQKLGNRTDLLLKLVGDNKKVAVIVNALDDQSSYHRLDRLKRECEMLEGIGLIPEELDLRKYFGNPKDLEIFLEDKSLVWIRGGNTFLLSRAFSISGFNKIIKSLIKKEKIVFGGYSAAVLMASETLLGAELVDDIYSVPESYPVNKQPLDSLNLLNFYLIPHFGSHDVWAKNVNMHIDYLKRNGKKVVTMCDGEIYYCNGDKGRIVK